MCEAYLFCQEKLKEVSVRHPNIIRLSWMLFVHPAAVTATLPSPPTEADAPVLHAVLAVSRPHKGIKDDVAIAFTDIELQPSEKSTCLWGPEYNPNALRFMPLDVVEVDDGYSRCSSRSGEEQEEVRATLGN